MRHPIRLALLLLAGCNQSLFDNSAGGSTDASTIPGTDGGDVTSCAAPCLGDAVAEWNGQQGGTKDRLRLRDYGRKPGHDAADMQAGQYMGTDGFLGRGTPTPAVVSCGDLGGSECAGLGDSLLLAPGQLGVDGFDPTVELVAPVSGTLRVYGTFAARTDSPGGRQRLLVGRNARSDLLFDGSYRPGEATGVFDLEVDALAGDRFALLSALPLDGMAVPLGVQFFASELASAPKRCQLGVKFEGGPKDLCHGDMMLERLSTDDPPVLSSSVVSLAPDLGSAEHFVLGSYLKGSTPADYSGDFTIQFWMKVSEPPDSFAVTYADWGCLEQGGVMIRPLDGNLVVGGYWKDMNIDYCAPGMAAPVFASGARPTDGGWHFYRIVRSTASANLRFCIDGAKRGETGVPADKNMTSSLPPTIGRNVDYNPAYYAGDIDEFRILKRALPCE